MQTSGTTILGMICNGFCVLASDCLATAKPLGTVVRANANKTCRYENLLIGCAGSGDCIEELEATLLASQFPPANTAEEALNRLMHHIDDRHSADWNQRGMECTLLLVGYVGNDPDPGMYIMERMTENIQYVWYELDTTVFAIGKKGLIMNLLDNARHRQQLTEKKAEDFAYRVIRVATMWYWGVGGDIRIRFIRTPRANNRSHSYTALLHQSSGPRNCNSPYDRRTKWTDDNANRRTKRLGTGYSRRPDRYINL